MVMIKKAKDIEFECDLCGRIPITVDVHSAYYNSLYDEREIEIGRVVNKHGRESAVLYAYIEKHDLWGEIESKFWNNED